MKRGLGGGSERKTEEYKGEATDTDSFSSIGKCWREIRGAEIYLRNGSGWLAQSSRPGPFA